MQPLVTIDVNLYLLCALKVQLHSGIAKKVQHKARQFLTVIWAGAYAIGRIVLTGALLRTALQALTLPATESKVAAQAGCGAAHVGYPGGCCGDDGRSCRVLMNLLC